MVNRDNLGLPNQVEAMVSLVIMTTLLSVVLQLIVSAAWMAMQAEKYNQAMHWIQADVEAVKFRAREYEKNAFPYSSQCSATGGVAAGLLTDVNTNTPAPKTIVSGTEMRLGPKFFGGENLLLTRIANTTTNSNPNKLLQLSYAVHKSDGSNSAPAPIGNPIASFTTEVVPYAALKCP
jgi:hypothetical protein